MGLSPIEESTYRAIQSLNRKIPNISDLTVRDLFAMNIVNGICASYVNGTPFGNPESEERIANWSYRLADAMLKASGRESVKPSSL